VPSGNQTTPSTESRRARAAPGGRLARGRRYHPRLGALLRALPGAAV